VPAAAHAALVESAKTAVPSFPAGEGLCKIPAAWLIEHGGFARGFTAGKAGVSTKHPLALVNLGGASARDVIALAVRIKRQVADRFGVDLRTEPIFMGFGDDPDVAYLNGARG
jgi:UDP-N-acetylmuramate dehydrogenase